MICLSFPLQTGWAKEEAQSTADAFNAGKEFATKGKDAAAQTLQSGTGAENLPYYTTEAPEGAHFQGGRNLIGSIGNNKQMECKHSRAGTGFAQQECDAVNFLSKNPTTRKKFKIDKNTDPILVGSKKIIDNPGSVPGALKQNCRIEKVTRPATTLSHTCTEAQTLEEQKCRRTLLVGCDPERDGCDQGGIIANSWAGDMATSFNADGSGNFILQFGTIADNYWRGWGAVFDRNLTFDIRDVKLITKFMLTRAAFDDWLLVKINDTTVYVGPHGGDRLEVVREKNKYSGSSYIRVKYCETCFGNPELNTSWNLTPNVDLRPYLRDGRNVLFMRTIVADEGEGAIQITTRQLCPRNCYDQWDDSQCARFEARTK